MSLNNVNSNAPSEMQPWVREVERMLATQAALIESQRTQIKALQKKK